MTVKAVLLGLFLALVFGAANACLSMKAGQDSGDAPRYIFGSMAFGGLIQILKDPRGLPVIRAG